MATDQSSQDAIPTGGNTPAAQHHHPAVTPSQASATQSAPTPEAASAPAAESHIDGADPNSVAQSGPSTTSHLPPPLPAPSPSDAGARTTVEVNGARVSLADQLGPAVVNADGTVSRIANWAEMTEVERRNTVRILGKRNKLRLEALRGQGQAGN